MYRWRRAGVAAVRSLRGRYLPDRKVRENPARGRVDRPGEKTLLISGDAPPRGPLQEKYGRAVARRTKRGGSRRGGGENPYGGGLVAGPGATIVSYGVSDRRPEVAGRFSGEQEQAGGLDGRSPVTAGARSARGLKARALRLVRSGDLAGSTRGTGKSGHAYEGGRGRDGSGSADVPIRADAAGSREPRGRRHDDGQEER